jgi:hypothetical protein
MNLSFVVRVCPQVSLNDFVKIDSDGEKYQRFTQIDISWFDQITFNQDDATNCTYLIFDFSDSDSREEIHDCFCGDFLAVMGALSKQKRTEFRIDSSDCPIEYEENGSFTRQITFIKNNKIHNKIFKDGKEFLYREKSDLHDIVNNLGKILKNMSTDTSMEGITLTDDASELDSVHKRVKIE